MRIIVFSGKGGSGVSTISAATAAASALSGRGTLLFGLGAGLGHILDTSVGSRPVAVAANLHAAEGGHAAGSPDEFRDWLRQLVDWRGLDVELADDLAGLPGMNHVGRLLELEDHVRSGSYDAVIVDAGPLAQFLDLPAALDAAARWLDRLFAPRQANVFEPFLRVFAGDYATAGEDVLDRGRELLGRLAALRDRLADPDVTSVRLVLAADLAAVAAGQEAVAALALFGYTADALILNLLLPDTITDPLFAAMLSEHQAARARIAEAVAPLPVLRLGLQPSSPRGLDSLARLASQLYEQRDPLGELHRGPAHTFGGGDGQYRLSLALPLARRDDLTVEQTDTGVAIHLNGRRRILPLPAEARHYENASWSFEDGVLTITFER